MKQETKEIVVGVPGSRSTTPITYCAGCHYGIITRLICEVIDELGIADKAIGSLSASCSAAAGNTISTDFIVSAHGRGPATATGIKAVHPDAVVFTIQGDGDIAAIGLGNFLHALLRGVKLTTIFLNNANYGQTGGQMAPTTPIGMRTTTTQSGRNPILTGYPIHLSEMAATIKGTAYSARCSVHTPANYVRTKKAIRTAFEKQIHGIGYGLVEILSSCPTGWGMTPIDSLVHLEGKMMAEFPLGEFKNVDRIA